MATTALEYIDDDLHLPERTGYRIKRALLGPPLTTAQLHEEKLSKKAALGVLSSDCISSSAYGTEEMLIALLAVFGLAGFNILLPMTAVVLLVLVVMTLSYREVVTVYTRAGGSYVVARENFGPRIAQIASVALLIDYIVTVAVQAAAGTAAITSLIPSLGHGSIPLAITVTVVLVLAYGNLRGVREAGRAFAFPTYFFVVAAGLVVIVGLVRELAGDLPKYPTNLPGMIDVHDSGHAIFTGAAIFVLLKAFANGGSSLTGLEAISNGVSAFKNPPGENARRTLSVMSALLGTLVLGISYLAYETHATPYDHGSPTVISQVAKAAFGTAWYGHLGFVIVQVATALILYTGANTPFTGFPFLASFIADDSFLPRQLTRRGQRLAFSNGIIVLTVAALALLFGVGAHVDKLVPFYAIGVFTGFTMAGFGMARYHHTHRENRWRTKLAVNATGGGVSLLIVAIFAVVKFTEGAWLVVLLFPLGWLALMRLNRQYRAEARSLDIVTTQRRRRADSEPLDEPGTDQPQTPPTAHYPRHVVLVLVDRLDLAVIRALRYAGSLRPTDVRAVHITLDSSVAAELRHDWIERGLGDRVPLELLACPDRRLIRASATLALRTVIQDQAEVTVLLPRRSFRRGWQRLLHDRTADRIAYAVSRIPHVAATIVPFDTTLTAATGAHHDEPRLPTDTTVDSGVAAPSGTDADSRTDTDTDTDTVTGDPGAAHPIAALRRGQAVVVEGTIKSVQVGTKAGKSLEVQVFDHTGGIRLLFFGRTAIPGLEPGTVVRASGRVGEYKGHLALANPRYELLECSEPAASPFSLAR
ncbi:amino acid permease [Jatrophihabitans telluris]|uniref:Amino acid permease n=1 Tax=Jatrophihabitans telluris TaxID=2038343 RepID=A0ABY4QX58_9ACTN|nr:amino acid permease [Jatrophihabitans telluris]UQX88073.1 amino acid permease [Jatrophihabitans telluris]